jgi:hypothetical protein
LRPPAEVSFSQSNRSVYTLLFFAVSERVPLITCEDFFSLAADLPVSALMTVQEEVVVESDLALR